MTVQGASRAERTRERLVETALELLEANGYEATSAAQIAGAAGVTEMTFFRHFATKDRILLEDPYDPLIAAAVAHEDRSLPALPRLVRGIRSALGNLPAPEGDLTRRRLRIAAATPSLRAGMWRNAEATEAVLADQLVADGTDPLSARVAAAAVLAALSTALLAWSTSEGGSLNESVLGALDVLEAGRA